MFTPQKIKELVQKALPDSQVTVTDLTGTRDHFQVYVISSAFEGKSPVARHRMVYNAIGSDVGGSIHALALQTLTPKEAGED
jgi:stress-induced morphogen